MSTPIENLAGGIERNYRQLNTGIGLIPLGLLHLHSIYLMLRRSTRRVKKFAKEHPYRFALMVLGLLLALGCTTVLPVLGFSAAGPVVGSIAAAWQSSIGLVSAGSLFAFLQSAAMGGAAIAGIAGLGAGGLTVAGLAALASIPEDRLKKIRDTGAAVVEGVAKVVEGIGGFAKGLWPSWGKK